jgi:antirestriction protein ArdC
MTEKAKEILDSLVAEITAEKTVAFVRERLFSDGAEIPCRHWSFLNQFMTYLSGTSDARGYRQWLEAGRQVKKGVHALYIIVPMIYKIKAEKENEEDRETLKGFKAMPVFRVEDTEGEELDYQKRIAEFDPESLPLIDIARSLGVTVSAGLTGEASGFYAPALKAIIMGCDDGQVFLHELSHAVDRALPGYKDDYAFKEVVAELSSAFLASLYGAGVNIDNTTAYIQGWVGKGHVAFQVTAALERVEAIYHYVQSVRPATIAA